METFQEALENDDWLFQELFMIYLIHKFLRS